MAARRLASLAEVALQLNGADTVEDLTALVVGRGLAALGADGGSVATRTGGGTLQLAITASLGEQTQADDAEMPLDGAAHVGGRGHRADRPAAAQQVAHLPHRGGGCSTPTA